MNEPEIQQNIENMSSEEMKENLQVLMNVNSIISRAQLASSLGKTHSGERNYYTEAGYPTTLSYEDFKRQYERNGLAKTIINAYPDATWRAKPRIYEDASTNDTRFEREWKKLIDHIYVYHYMRRVDRMAGKGNYSLLVLGFDDGRSPDAPVETAENLLYVQPVDQENATINTWDLNQKSERYGRPVSYNVSFKFGKSIGSDTTQVQTKVIHWSRVIHVTSEDLEESDIFSKPRLKAVYNRLQDIEILAAGATEMFWRGGFPGIHFDKKEDAEYTDQSLTQLKEQIQGYVDGLQRYLRTSGIDVNEFEPQVANPAGHFEMEMKLISIATRIPLRILYGAESGELASSQDMMNWISRVDERRKDHAEPMILRRFVDRLISVGVLPKPVSGRYLIEWPDIRELDSKTQATVSETMSRVLHNYVRDEGLAETVIPVDDFLKHIMKLPEDVVEEIKSKDDPEARQRIQREVRLKGKDISQDSSEEEGE